MEKFGKVPRWMSSLIMEFFLENKLISSVLLFRRDWNGWIFSRRLAVEFEKRKLCLDGFEKSNIFILVSASTPISFDISWVILVSCSCKSFRPALKFSISISPSPFSVSTDRHE